MERRDNSGAIFVNNRKVSPSHPEYTGSATLGGKEYWVNVWEKQDKNGKPWFSLSFNPKQPAAQPTQHEAAKSNGFVDDGFGDDIPFD